MTDKLSTTAPRNSDLKVQINKTTLPLLMDIELEEDVDYLLCLAVSVEGILTKGETKTAIVKYNGGEYDLVKINYDLK
jgi:hypothetical protein